MSMAVTTSLIAASGAAVRALVIPGIARRGLGAADDAAPLVASGNTCAPLEDWPADEAGACCVDSPADDAAGFDTGVSERAGAMGLMIESEYVGGKINAPSLMRPPPPSGAAQRNHVANAETTD